MRDLNHLERQLHNAVYEGLEPNHSALNIAVVDASNGRVRADLSLNRETDGPIEAASINKLGIVYAYNQIHGEDRLGTEIELEDIDKVPGNGILKYFPDGYVLPVREVVRLTLDRSDNTAAKMLVRHMRGPYKVNDVLQAKRSGLTYTLLKPLDAEDAPETKFEFGETTAIEAAELLRRSLTVRSQRLALQRGNFREGLRQDIETQQWDDAEPKSSLVYAKASAKLADLTHNYLRLPRSDRAYQHLLRHIYHSTAFPNKEGQLPGLRHDDGLIGKLIVSVLSTHPTGPQEQANAQAALGIQNRIGKLIAEY